MIEFQGVSKVFAGHPAVKDLTLELREGAFSVLVGLPARASRRR